MALKNICQIVIYLINVTKNILISVFAISQTIIEKSRLILFHSGTLEKTITILGQSLNDDVATVPNQE